MKRLLIFLHILAITLLFADEVSSRDKIISNLVEIENSVIKELDFHERRRIIALFDEITTLLEEPAPVVKPQITYKAIDSKELKAVRDRIRKTKDDKEKKLMVISALNQRSITVRQLDIILVNFKSEYIKLDCLKSVYNSITDKENIRQIQFKTPPVKERFKSFIQEKENKGEL